MTAAGAIVHRGLAWGCILLAMAGWAIILGGVASLQQACSGGMVTTLSDLAALQQAAGRRRLLQNPLAPVGGFPGAVGYLAPVGCNKFLSYPWWIWALDTFVLALLAVGATTFIGRARGMLVSMCAVLLVLLMNTANTFLYFNHINGLTGKVASRARTLVAGSIISSIAYFLLIMVLGWHNEDAAVEEHYDAEAAGKKKGRKKAAGGGGLLGALGLKKGERASVEEDPPGAGTAGSPRYIQVPGPTAGAAPTGGSYPGTVGVAGPAPGTIIPGPISSHVPGGGAAPTITTTTTVPVTSATAVPVSTQAAPVVRSAI